MNDYLGLIPTIVYSALVPVLNVSYTGLYLYVMIYVMIYMIYHFERQDCFVSPQSDNHNAALPHHACICNGTNTTLCRHCMLRQSHIKPTVVLKGISYVNNKIFPKPLHIPTKHITSYINIVWYIYIY